MTATTDISWADVTWSPLIGCTRVSAGCDNCYAIQTARVRSGHPNPKVSIPFAGTVDRTSGRLDWTGRVNLIERRLTDPLRWRKPRRVFVNSMSDLFHDAVPDEYIARVWAVMAATPQHTYQILTKRHGRMRSLIDDGGQRLLEATGPDTADVAHALYDAEWPLPNVWLGVSVEDQKRADLRIPALLDTPAAVRFLSCEPLLGNVDLASSGWLAPDEFDRKGVDWCVVGGESGARARPMHPHWARKLRDQCSAAGVAFHYKQSGEWAETAERIIAKDRNTMALHPAGMTALTPDNPFDPFDRGHPFWVGMRRVGVRAAGRELDGRTWDEFPAVARV